MTAPAERSRFHVTLYNRHPTDAELLADLHRATKSCGHRPLSYGLYGSIGTYSVTTLRHRFGSWSAALKAANLTAQIDRDVSAPDLLDNLANVWRTLGRQPMTRDMVKRDGLSRYAVTPYVRRFGSWHKALLAFGDHAASRRLRLPGMTARKKIKHPGQGRTSKRQVNWRLRSKVLIRDNCTCRLCGTSPLKDSEVTLHVDHIVPWSKGGRTVLANLQTLCLRCNIGKADQRLSSLSRSDS